MFDKPYVVRMTEDIDLTFASTANNVGSKTQRDADNIVHVQIDSAPKRVEHAIRAVGWPMIQAGLSTVCCVLPLIFVNTYASSVFLTVITLVVSFGIGHGLIVLPVVLINLPECLSKWRCCRV
ncbi:hypothetical protein Q1695_015597 [Nippostrongylus brasiliensis]|nr:hypothetical protein Q1695_015597 [Nippostrongylus brasiliensis]